MKVCTLQAAFNSIYVDRKINKSTVPTLTISGCCMKVLIYSFALVLTLQAFTADKMNVLLFCVDDLRPELNCYGVDYIKSPNIDAIAAKGMVFSNHYVQAPTCGASRYTLLTGQYGTYGNGALFSRGKKVLKDPKSMILDLDSLFFGFGLVV